MIAKTKYHTVAEWNFSLWVALQGSMAGAAEISLPLREFANNSRRFKAFAAMEIVLLRFFSFAGSVCSGRSPSQALRRTKLVLSQRGDQPAPLRGDCKILR